MTAWTDLTDYEVPQLMNAAGMVILKDNITYLLNPNIAQYHHPGTGGNYTVSGSLGVDIDATNFSLSLTTYGGPVLACFYGNFSCPVASSMRIAIIYEDSLSHIGRNLYNSFDAELAYPASANGMPLGFMKVFKDLPAATYTFKAIWGVSGADTATLYVAKKPYMIVREGV